MARRQKGKGNEIVTIRIKDFTKDKDEPAYDVELYLNNKFDNTWDGVMTTSDNTIPKKAVLVRAIQFAINKLENLQTEVKDREEGFINNIK